MRKFRTPKPGDKVGRASDLRELADEVERQGKLSVEGAILHDSAEGRHLIVPGNLLAFWARLTSEGTAADAGRYAWIEQERTDFGEFTDLLYGRTGTVALDPAIEANGAKGLKTGGPGVGLYVYLTRSYGEGVQSGVKQEWLFVVSGVGEDGAVPATITGTLPDGYHMTGYVPTGYVDGNPGRWTGRQPSIFVDLARITAPP